MAMENTLFDLVIHNDELDFDILSVLPPNCMLTTHHCWKNMLHADA